MLMTKTTMTFSIFVQIIPYGIEKSLKAAPKTIIATEKHRKTKVLPTKPTTTAATELQEMSLKRPAKKAMKGLKVKAAPG